MARRVPAADSTEGSFALDRSGPSNESLLNDESASSDYFSDYLDLDQLANIEFGNVDGSGVVNDDATDDEQFTQYRPAPRPQQSISRQQPPPAQSASQPVSTTDRPQLSYGSQARPTHSDLNQLQHILQPRFQLPQPDSSSLPPFPLPAAPLRTLNHSDSAINIDDDEDDDLEFLGQNDFSSPSILNDSPSRVSQQITLSDDDDGDGIDDVIMPQTRRRLAASRSVSVADPFPLPLPGDPIAATPARSSRARAGSNAILSSPAAGTGTATPSAVRTSTKRRRSNDPGVGSSSTTLPPIATLLASVGNGSSSSGGGSNTGRATYGDSQASSSSSNSGGNNATSQASRPRLTPKRPRVVEPIILDDDLFGSDDDDLGVEMVNLVDVDRPQAAAVKDEAASEENAAQEAAEAKAEPKNLTKLSAQQCVICMDDMTDITVTHCGHLFCGECLFASLNSTDQRVCPICRSKVEFRVPQMSAAKMSRSYFHLQIKMRPRE